MGDISAHFSRHEFECKCGCRRSSADYLLILMLESARAYFGTQLVITANGGFRCDVQNKLKGGVEYSQHTQGKAADHVIPGVRTKELFDFYDQQYPNTGGVGYYPHSHFVHVDSRLQRARWSESSP